MKNILLVIIQTILCIVIALSAFVLKLYGGEMYGTARTYYYTYLNASLLVEDNYES